MHADVEDGMMRLIKHGIDMTEKVRKVKNPNAKTFLPIPPF